MERKHKVENISVLLPVHFMLTSTNRNWQGWWLQEDTICRQYTASTVHGRLRIVQEHNSSAIARYSHHTTK